MGYDRSVYDAVYKILSDRRLNAEQTADRRKTDFYRVEPRGREIERTLAKTGAAAAKAVVLGGNVQDNLEKLRNSNLKLQTELKQLLAKQSMSPDDLKPHYTCSKCHDTGSVDGLMCSCMKALLKEEAVRQLNAETPLKLCTFDTFDVSYYSLETDGSGMIPRDVMESIFLRCRKYAENFSSRTSENLLFSGKTGLGKTHLSLAVANRVIERGFGVIYGSAENLLSKLQDEHFGRSDGNTMKNLLDCDLLILDDLGTEFKSSFTVSAIYNIINSRQLSEKPVIISTNLSVKEMEQYYTERFSSRIIGGYTMIPFRGSDVRQLKRRREKN